MDTHRSGPNYIRTYGSGRVRGSVGIAGPVRSVLRWAEYTGHCVICVALSIDSHEPILVICLYNLQKEMSPILCPYLPWHSDNDSELLGFAARALKNPAKKRLPPLLLLLPLRSLGFLRSAWPSPSQSDYFSCSCLWVG